jgi:hypothetical protein
MSIWQEKELTNENQKRLNLHEGRTSFSAKRFCTNCNAELAVKWVLFRFGCPESLTDSQNWFGKSTKPPAASLAAGRCRGLFSDRWVSPHEGRLCALCLVEKQCPHSGLDQRIYQSGRL